MNSISRFLKNTLPTSLILFFTIFLLFSLLSIQKIDNEEKNNLEKSVIDILKNSIQDPLNFGDQVEVTRRLKNLINESLVQNICVKSKGFIFLKCSSELNLNAYTMFIIHTPSLDEDLQIYILFKHNSVFTKIFWLLLPLILFSITALLFGRYITTKYENYLMQDFKLLAQSLLDNKLNSSFSSIEFNNIRKDFETTLSKINLSEKNEYLLSLSKKLAHDIRSPLSTLNLISSKIDNPDAKELQLAVIKQINEIADNLLKENKNISINTITYTQLFQQLESEFKLKEFQISRTIKFIFDKNDTILNSATAPSFLYSVLNNLIQNSIEATNPNTADITITASNLKKYIMVTVKDNGKGIPEEIINILGTREISFGKSNTNSGNGIGFYSAKKSIDGFGGSLKIQSQLNYGTEVKISLPV